MNKKILDMGCASKKLKIHEVLIFFSIRKWIRFWTRIKRHGIFLRTILKLFMRFMSSKM